MNFGAFAGGFSQGLNDGIKQGKTIRELIKESKMQETLDKAREEAGAAYDAQSVAKGGLPETKTEAPAQPAQPATQPTAPTAPTEVSASAPAVSAASPTANPDPASAATAAASQPPPSVSTQTPAAPGASGEGNAGEAEAKAAIASPTPQQTAAAGVPGVAPATPAAPAAKPAAAAQPAQQPVQAKADPAARSLYIQKHMAQKAQEYFISTGDMETADKYGKYAESLAGKQAIKAWADAKSAPDIDTRAKSFGQYYTDHVNDDVDYVGHKILTKEDGSQVAVVSLKDKKTGKTSEMELTDDKMIQLGDAWNPAAVFKNEQSRAAAASTQKAKMGEEAYKSKLKLGEEKYKADRLDAREGIKATNAENAEIKKGQRSLSEITLRGQIEAQNVGEKAKAELTAKTEALKAAGYSDDEIKPMVPMLLKVGEYKKMTDPAERRAIIGTELMKSDPTFSRATAEEQKARIDKAMSAIMGGAAPSASPAAGGKPAAAGPAAATPTYVRDKTTGQIFKLEGGQKIPVGPAPAPKPAPGPAGGMPPPNGATGSW